MTRQLDHLVYAAPDLKGGIDALEATLGIRASPGGAHPGWGTRNALIALGDDSFIEIIGPDPDRPKPSRPRPFGIDALTSPRLLTWAMKGTDLDSLVTAVRRQGVALGDVKTGTRVRPDSTPLMWRLTDPYAVIADGIVPFVIDWGVTPHPARTAVRGATLVDFRAEHPDPESVQPMLNALRIELPVTRGARPSLIATIDCLRGRVEIR